MKFALKDLDNERLNGSRVTLEEAVSTSACLSISYANLISINRAVAEAEDDHLVIAADLPVVHHVVPIAVKVALVLVLVPAHHVLHVLHALARTLARTPAPEADPLNAVTTILRSRMKT